MNIFPVTESTLSAAHLSLFIRQCYGFSILTECKLFRTGMNHLYMVTHGNDKYVLRIYTLHWRTKSEIEEEVRLLRHLKDHDVCVSYPVADVKGEYVQELDAPEGMRYAVLFSFALGKKMPDFSADISYDIGIAMAKMHQASKDFMLRRINYSSQTLLSDSLKRTKAFFGDGSDNIIFLEQLTDSLAKQYAGVTEINVRYGAVHFDFWFDNMHIDDGGGITVFDFDFCGNGWQCHDISYFLFQLFNTNQDNNEYEHKAGAFLKGYETIIKLTDEEKRIIPFLCLGVMSFYISMQCEKYYTWSNIFLNEGHLKRLLHTLKRWMVYNGLELGS